MRLIDADRMKEELLWGNVFLPAIQTNTRVDLIDNQPTINPENVRPRGRWKDACYYHYCPLCYECSNCGLKLMYKPNYCPNCGSKMEGKTDEA